MRIDLRSDTVTKPNEGMRRAMASAEVGDDVYGEDLTVRRLEQQTAELLGKPAGLFVPSGTMANQIALVLQCRPGDEVIIGEGNHCAYYEAGAAAALAGVQFAQAGHGGLFTLEQMRAACRPKEHYLPRTSLVALENTHNRAGGRVFPQADVDQIASGARTLNLRVHLDGARLWNAAVATGLPLARLAAPADTVSVCFSKGLGAPVGSLLAGQEDGLAEARRIRRRLGGGMRQAGILAAAALYALEHNVSRLEQDHARARRLANGLAQSSKIQCTASSVHTNIVNFQVPGDAQQFVLAARERGVLVNAIGPRSVRAVTHLDLAADDIDQALAVLARLADDALSGFSAPSEGA